MTEFEANLRSRVRRIGRALRHRNYRLFFAGQLVSLAGTWMQTTALAWVVYRLTGSAIWLGLAGFASQIPIFLFAQIGGAVADQHDRHRILVVTQILAMVLAFVLSAITFLGELNTWVVLSLAALLGVVNAFDIPTRQAFVVEMVSDEDLQNAIALNSSMFNMARLIGPALAGITLAAFGEGWCFFANAMSFLAVIVGLLAMRRPPFIPKPQAEPILHRVLQGFSFAHRTLPLRTILLLIGFMSLLSTPYAILMPIFANRILGGGPEHLGSLMSAAGLGALLGALALASRASLRGLGRAIGAAVIGFGGLMVLFAISHWFWLSMLLLIAIGYCQMTHMAASNTLIQEMVPDSFRGRVMAMYSMLFMGMAPLGAMVSGILAETLGAQLTVGISGVLCLIGGSFFTLKLLPRWRLQARQLILQKRGGK